MRVGLTGTPGTGKTSAADLLETSLDVIHLNEVIREHELYTRVDEARDSLVADLEAVSEFLAGTDDVLFESHLAHYFEADLTVVLRCHPETLERRLLDRGESPEKARENAESEALDGILIEAVERQGEGTVAELETTEATPAETARAIKAFIGGERARDVGIIDYTGYL